MKINASAGRSKKCLHKHCESITLKAQTEAEAEFLAIIYRTVTGIGIDKEPIVVILDPEQPDKLGYWGRHPAKKKQVSKT